MANPILFFILIAMLFPLGVGAEANLLQSIAPGIIWVSALLAAMLSLDKVIQNRYGRRFVRTIFIECTSVVGVNPGESGSTLVSDGLAFIAGFAVIGRFFRFTSSKPRKILMLTLLLGTPVLSLIGAIGVALTVGLRSGGVLLSLLVLPLYIPVLIFSCIAVDMSMTGLPVDAHLKILSAMLFMSLALAPWPAAAALKISLN